MTDAEVLLDPDPRSVGAARRFVASRLAEWGLEELVADAGIIVSELVTNAVLHARTPIRVRLEREPSLRLEVIDASPVLPHRRAASTGSTTGRGLVLVSSLASAWGVDEREDGKAVWVEFERALAEPEGGPQGAGATAGAFRTAGGPRSAPSTSGAERPRLLRTA